MQDPEAEINQKNTKIKEKDVFTMIVSLVLVLKCRKDSQHLEQDI